MTDPATESFLAAHKRAYLFVRTAAGEARGWHAGDLAAAVATLRQRHPDGPLLVIVDFLQLVGDAPGAATDLRQRIGTAAYADVKSNMRAVTTTNTGIKTLQDLKGKRVFITATGDGNVFCANARTGEPIWRVPLFKAGINSTTVVHNNDKVIAIFGTPYEPGQMVCMKIPQVEPTSATNAPANARRHTLPLIPIALLRPGSSDLVKRSVTPCTPFTTSASTAMYQDVSTAARSTTTHSTRRPSRGSSNQRSRSSIESGSGHSQIRWRWACAWIIT